VRLKYVGVNTDGVDIPEIDRVGENAVKLDEIIEVDDAVGKRLAESSEWQVTSRTKGDKD
jgi:hypothetical protein